MRRAELTSSLTWRAAACAAAVLCCLSRPAGAQPNLQDVKNATVRIVASGTAGSGVVVHLDARQVLILTAHHVVEGDTAVDVFFQGALTPLRAQVVKSAPDRDDLALLLVARDGTPLPSDPPVLTHGANVTEGEQVYAMGHAGDIRWVPSAMAPVVQATDSENTARFRFANIGVDQGYSGGPIIAGDGRLVGVFVSMTRAHGLGVKFDRALEIVKSQWGVQTLNRLQLRTAPAVSANPRPTAPTSAAAFPVGGPAARPAASAAPSLKSAVDMKWPAAKPASNATAKDFLGEWAFRRAGEPSSAPVMTLTFVLNDVAIAQGANNMPTLVRGSGFQTQVYFSGGQGSFNRSGTTAGGGMTTTMAYMTLDQAGTLHLNVGTLIVIGPQDDALPPGQFEGRRIR